AVCEKNLAELITKIQEPLVSCGSGISQKACLAALQGPQEFILEMVKVYKNRRDAVIEILRNNNLYLYTPSGAFYILIDISQTGMNSTEFALELLKEKKVAVAPGETFGETSDSFVRISFCEDTDKLIEGVSILCKRINARRK
ncbi:MAG TPA: aminotransferase class I/II-fold pyridoxal phosphate-dependent enzyme, partial [Anaerolineae bacterium]|nr:aminotransferase class I/II-fold pyridoxal phosphate-dependent enzyme [Anaerolineae bacterium]